MILSYIRGYEITWLKNLGTWIYVDNGEGINDERPCKKCSKSPTSEGYDACLGFLPGVKSACCGHGIEVGFKIRRVDG